MKRDKSTVGNRMLKIKITVTANWTKIPLRDFIFARVKTGQVGT